MTNLAVCGRPGCGKNLFLTYSAINFASKGWNIISNYQIYNPKTREPISRIFETAGDLERARKGRLYIDEIAKLADARNAMKGNVEGNDNKLIDAVTQKLRKRQLSMEYACQDFSMADARIRENTNFVVLPEIYYLINGKEFKVVQDYFNPINMDILFPYAYVRSPFFDAFKFMIHPHNTEHYLRQSDLLDVYNFKASPIGACYDTSEEIKGLITSEMQRGIKREEDAVKVLTEHFPEGHWKLNPDSGMHMDNSFDIEGVVGTQLFILDATTLVKAPKAGGGFRYYLNLQGKDVSKYKRVEDYRKAKTLFIFMMDEHWYLLPSKYIWNITRNSVPILNVIEFCEKIT